MSRPTSDIPGYASHAEVKAIMEAYEREIVYPAAKKGILLGESWDVIDPPSKQSDPPSKHHPNKAVGFEITNLNNYIFDQLHT